MRGAVEQIAGMLGEAVGQRLVVLSGRVPEVPREAHLLIGDLPVRGVTRGVIDGRKAVVVVIPVVVDGKLDKGAKRRQSNRDGIKVFWTSIKKAGNQHILVISLTVLTCIMCNKKITMSNRNEKV